MTLKGAAARLLAPFFRLFFRHVFLSAFAAADDRPLWIVDVDNTVADTWPSLLKPYPSEAARLASLPPLEGMCGRIRTSTPSSVRVLFLTVRPYGMYRVTRDWLKRQGLPSGLCDLVLVERPGDKLALLKLGFAGRAPRRVEYYDDLSRGHEAGTVEFYDDIIAAVKELPLKYAGYGELAGINGSHDQIHL